LTEKNQIKPEEKRCKSSMILESITWLIIEEEKTTLIRRSNNVPIAKIAY